MNDSAVKSETRAQFVGYFVLNKLLTSYSSIELTKEEIEKEERRIIITKIYN